MNAAYSPRGNLITGVAQLVPATQPTKKDSFVRAEDDDVQFETDPTGIGLVEHYEGVRPDTDGGEQLFVASTGRTWKASEIIVGPKAALVEAETAGGEIFQGSYQIENIEEPKAAKDQFRQAIIRRAAEDFGIEITEADLRDHRTSPRNWHITLE